MEALLKCIWAGLIPVALFFISLSLVSRFDKSFRYFGVAQLFLCAMTGIDLWILSAASDPAQHLFWQRMMFTVGCLFAVFYFWYMSELTGWRRPALIRILGAYALVLCVMFRTDAMFHLSGGKVVRGPAYDFLFPAFMTLCLFGALLLIVRRMRRISGREHRTLYFHLVGFLMLFAFGVLDVLFTYYIPSSLFVSFNTFGSLAFGISTSMVFLDRFLNLLREREKMHAQVIAAVSELEAARALGKVGESVAMLNHEIKNYVATIRGTSLLLEEGGPPEALRGRLHRIRNASQGLENLSRSVLDLPHMMAVGGKGRVDLKAIAEKCARETLPEGQCAMRWLGPANGKGVAADAGKLEFVFSNLFKNAWEAGAERIEVRCALAGGVLKLEIGDDGRGCGPEELQHLGKAFHTTKRNEGGSGLGLCVARAIMESHGGSLGLKAKHGPAGTGMIVELAFPHAGESEAEETAFILPSGT